MSGHGSTLGNCVADDVALLYIVAFSSRPAANDLYELAKFRLSNKLSYLTPRAIWPSLEKIA